MSDCFAHCMSKVILRKKLFNFCSRDFFVLPKKISLIQNLQNLYKIIFLSFFHDTYLS